MLQSQVAEEATSRAALASQSSRKLQKHDSQQLQAYENYTGFFRQNLREYFGVKEITSQNYEYKGFFSQGKKHGYGSEIQDSKKYIGTFNQDKRDGFGVLFKKDTQVYSGEWRMGQKFGFCVQISGEGSVYKGTIDGESRTGFGKQTDRNSGVVYTGEYLENREHGFGKLESPTELFLGYFKVGVKNGLGYVRSNSDSQVYFGY